MSFLLQSRIMIILSYTATDDNVFFLFVFKMFSEFEEFHFHFSFWHVPKLHMSLLCSFSPYLIKT